MSWDDASGVNDYEVEVNFTCSSCEQDNVEVLGLGRGSSVTAECQFCRSENETGS